MHITTSIGTCVLLCNMLTNPEDKAPKPICRNPNNADALPADALNGASAIADALGNIKP